MDFTAWVNNLASEGLKLLTREPRVEATNAKVKDAVSDMASKTFVLAGSNFTRLAGISGGIAIGMSAYGAHAFNSSMENDEEGLRRKNVFESGSKMHLIHSLALLGVPLTRRPKLIGSLMLTGMVIFSGTCYYSAITGDRRVRVATPYGGMLLIIAWFLMVL